MLILSIILSLILLFTFYLFVLSMRRINRYEEIFIQIDDYIKYSAEKLKVIDNKGSFESDDEIGFIFEEIKLIQEQLNLIFNREVIDGEKINDGKTEKTNEN